METRFERRRMVLKKGKFATFIAGVMVVVFFSGCSLEKDGSNLVVDSLAIPYTVRSAWPHDPKAFTEGFLIHKETVYESTGRENESWIAIVNINNGSSDKKVILDKKYFGEGITILNNKIYQLTYETKIGFVYDLKTFKKIREFTYDTEGWGMTTNGEHLIMSDGTDKLFFLDTVSLTVVKTLPVTDEHGKKIIEINELEYVNGDIYANVWKTNLILKIDGTTGKLKGRIDLTSLVQKTRRSYPSADVLNGIAYHESTKSLLVTGKYWPNIFILRLAEPDSTKIN